MTNGPALTPAPVVAYFGMSKCVNRATEKCIRGPLVYTAVVYTSQHTATFNHARSVTMTKLYVIGVNVKMFTIDRQRIKMKHNTVP